MTTDPAVQKAQHLWEKKDYRAAVTTLVLRIDELNQLLEQQSMLHEASPSAQSQTSDSQNIEQASTTERANAAHELDPDITEDRDPDQRSDMSSSKKHYILLTIIVMFISIVVVLIVMVAHFNSEATRRTTDYLQISHYSSACQVYFISSEEYCDKWASSIVSSHEEAAVACMDAYGEDMFRCLYDHYAPLPFN